tara:strand:+ start:1399 stop:1677 length:279 start_codon:yes stop_codon:yes gene_type:complete
MALTFKQCRKENYNTKLLKQFRTYCKYDNEWFRIENMLWDECIRRQKGESLIPDAEYYNQCNELYYDTNRQIGGMEESKKLDDYNEAMRKVR